MTKRLLLLSGLFLMSLCVLNAQTSYYNFTLTPPNNSVGISPKDPIFITFENPTEFITVPGDDRRTIKLYEIKEDGTEKEIYVYKDGANAIQSCSFSSSGEKLTFTIKDIVEGDKEYILRVGIYSLIGKDGFSLPKKITWRFTTGALGPNKPPKITSTPQTCVVKGAHYSYIIDAEDEGGAKNLKLKLKSELPKDLKFSTNKSVRYAGKNLLIESGDNTFIELNYPKKEEAYLFNTDAITQDATGNLYVTAEYFENGRDCTFFWLGTPQLTEDVIYKITEKEVKAVYRGEREKGKTFQDLQVTADGKTFFVTKQRSPSNDKNGIYKLTTTPDGAGELTQIFNTFNSNRAPLAMDKSKENLYFIAHNQLFKHNVAEDSETVVNDNATLGWKDIVKFIVEDEDTIYAAFLESSNKYVLKKIKLSTNEVTPLLGKNGQQQGKDTGDANQVSINFPIVSIILEKDTNNELKKIYYTTKESVYIYDTQNNKVKKGIDLPLLTPNIKGMVRKSDGYFYILNKEFSQISYHPPATSAPEPANGNTYAFATNQTNHSLPAASPDVTAYERGDYQGLLEGCEVFKVSVENKIEGIANDKAGDYPIELEVEDTEGAKSTQNYTLKIGVPEFKNCPEDINRDISGTSEQITWTDPTVDNGCGQPLAISSQTHNSGDTFNLGTTEVKYIATDEYGNTGTCTFNVTLKQKVTKPPKITSTPPTCVVKGAYYSYMIDLEDEDDGISNLKLKLKSELPKDLKFFSKESSIYAGKELRIQAGDPTPIELNYPQKEEAKLFNTTAMTQDLAGNLYVTAEYFENAREDCSLDEYPYSANSEDVIYKITETGVKAVYRGEREKGQTFQDIEVAADGKTFFVTKKKSPRDYDNAVYKLVTTPDGGGVLINIYDTFDSKRVPLAMDKNKENLYFTAHQKLFKYDVATGTTIVVNDNASLGWEKVNKFIVDDEDTIYAAFAVEPFKYVLKKIKLSTNEVTPLLGENGQPGKGIGNANEVSIWTPITAIAIEKNTNNELSKIYYTLEWSVLVFDCEKGQVEVVSDSDVMNRNFKGAVRKNDGYLYVLNGLDSKITVRQEIDIMSVPEPANGNTYAFATDQANHSVPGVPDVESYENLKYEGQLKGCQIFKFGTENKIAGIANDEAGDYPVELEVEDADGGKYTQNYTLKIGVPEFVNCPEDINRDISGTSEQITWTDPTVDNGCGQPLAISSQTHHSGDTFGLGSTPVTYTATDAYGNTATCSFNIILKKATLPPTITCPANIVKKLRTNEYERSISWEDPEVTGENVTLTSNFKSGHTFPAEKTEVIYTAKNAGGEVTCSFFVELLENHGVEFTTKPAQCFAEGDTYEYDIEIKDIDKDNVTLLTDNLPDWLTLSALVYDDTKKVWTATISGSTAGHLGEQGYYLLTALDNRGSFRQQIVPYRVGKLTINNCPNNIYGVSNDSNECGAIVTWHEPTATDACGKPVAMVRTGQAPGTLFPVGKNTVTYTATANGQTKTCSFTVEVVDTEKPVITLPTVLASYNADTNCETEQTFIATATDNCGTPQVLYFVDDKQVTFPYKFPTGVTTVKVVAIDVHNNRAEDYFTVNVKDTEKPVIENCPANIEVTANYGETEQFVTWVSPTATDNCELESLTCIPERGSNFTVGETKTVVYTAKDTSGNTTTCTFTVTVKEGKEGVKFVSTPQMCFKEGTPYVYDAKIENKSGEVVTISAENLPAGLTITPSGNTAKISGTVAKGSYTYKLVAKNTADVVVAVQTVSFRVDKLKFLSSPSTIYTTNNIGKCGAIVTWHEPTVTDACGNLVAVVRTGQAPNTEFSVGKHTIVYKATADGETITSSFTIEVADTEKPTIELPTVSASYNAENNCEKELDLKATVSDNCDVAEILYFVDDTQIIFPHKFTRGATNVKVVAVDVHGNRAEKIFTVNVVDTESPVITNCPANIEVTANYGETEQFVTWASPTATDNCELESFTSNFERGSNFPIGNHTVTYTAKDTSGNTTTCTFTVTVNEGKEGVKFISTPQMCFKEGTPYVYDAKIENKSGETVTISAENLPAGLTITPSGNTAKISGTVGKGSYTYKLVAKNTADVVVAVQTVSFKVGKLTFLSSPSTIYATNDAGKCGANVTWSIPTAMNACGNLVPVKLESGLDIGSFFKVGTHTVTYSTTADGETITTSFPINVADTEKPTITLPTVLASYNVENNCEKELSFEATASDNCGIAELLYFVDDAQITFPHRFTKGVTNVQVVAIDVHNNRAEKYFTVNVEDTESPVITNCPANIEVTANYGETEQFVTWVSPIATDNCELASFTSDLERGSNFPIGETTVTYTAKDASGNITTCEFTVTVEEGKEGVKFVSTPQMCFKEGTPYVYDAKIENKSGEVVTISAENLPAGLTITPSGNTAKISGTVAKGSYTYKLVAKNTADVVVAVQTVSFRVGKLTFLSSPSTIYATNDAGKCGANVTWSIPTAMNACGNLVPVKLESGLDIGSFFEVGTHTVTYSATADGETVTTSFPINVADTEKPTITLPTVLASYNAENNCEKELSFEATATDNCGVSEVLYFIDDAQITFPHKFAVGVTNVQVQAVDIHNNRAKKYFTVNVKDTEKPVIENCPANIEVTANFGETEQAVTWVSPTATDNCQLASFTSVPERGAKFPLGTTPVVYTATDASGNTETCTFTVTVKEGKEGVKFVSTPQMCFKEGTLYVYDAKIENKSGETVTISAKNLPAGLTITPSGNTAKISGTVAKGSYTYELLVKNTADVVLAVQTVSFKVGKLTFLSSPSTIYATNDAGKCGANVTWSLPTAMDACGNLVTAKLESGLDIGSFFKVGTHTVTYSATADGETVTTNFSINVEDTEEPTITLPTVSASYDADNNCEKELSFEATATDNCGVAELRYFVDNAQITFPHKFAVGATNVQVEAIDIHNNKAEKYFTVTVKDTENPVITDMPADIVKQNERGACEVMVDWVAPKAFDACGNTLEVTASIAPKSKFAAGTTTTVTYKAVSASGRILEKSFKVTILKPTPKFTPIAPICHGEKLVLPARSLNGIEGTWSPEIDVTKTTEYTFTPNANYCAEQATLSVEVKAKDHPDCKTEEEDPCLKNPTAQPSLLITEATCTASARVVITNYDSNATYILSDGLKLEGAAIKGFEYDKTYTVKAKKNKCVSEETSFILSEPENVETPTLVITEATCETPATVKITNYDATVTYIFSKGLYNETDEVLGFELGQNYTVRAIKNGCESENVAFTLKALAPLDAPEIEVVNATCDAPAIVRIVDYSEDVTYEFNGDLWNDGALVKGFALNKPYEIYVKYGECESTATEFRVTKDCPPTDCADLWENMHIGQFLSPNDDGTNDFWDLGDLKKYCEDCKDVNVLYIYNRYGSLVYKKTDYMLDDDRFRGISEGDVGIEGRLLPSGIYFYIIEVSGKVNAKTGYLYILDGKEHK